jgi:endonuclease G
MKKSNVYIVAFLLFVVVFYVWFKPLDQKKIADSAYTNTQSEVQKETRKETRKPIVSTDSEEPNTTQEIIDYSQLELPAFSKSDAIIRHFAYTLCYNETYEQAAWVAYELTSDETIKRYERTNRFLIDGAVRTNSATDKDYKKSGYDRGHLAPAGDMSWSATAMEESFYYSNMSPQEPSFNRGIWKKLEEQVRSWAIELGAIYVVTGPVLKGQMNSIGQNNVAVPNYYYKVILDNSGSSPKAIGFIMRNTGSKASLAQYAVSIDSVENFTGIDFFPGLADKTEQKVENSVCTACWNWSITRNQNRKTSATASTAIQCSGITKKGLRCKRMTKDPSGKCYQHD